MLPAPLARAGCARSPTLSPTLPAFALAGLSVATAFFSAARTLVGAATAALVAAALAAAAAAPASAALAAGVVTCLHARALFEAKLAFGHDRLAGREALRDDDDLAHALRDDDRPLFDRAVLFDDEDELALLANLHGLARHDRRLVERHEPQAHARELARPQTIVLVRGRGLELDRVGRRVHRVVDEREFALDRFGITVMRRRGREERVLRHAVLDVA